MRTWYQHGPIFPKPREEWQFVIGPVTHHQAAGFADQQNQIQSQVFCARRASMASRSLVTTRATVLSCAMGFLRNLLLTQTCGHWSKPRTPLKQVLKCEVHLRQNGTMGFNPQPCFCWVQRLSQHQGKFEPYHMSHPEGGVMVSGGKSAATWSGGWIPSVSWGGSCEPAV